MKIESIHIKKDYVRNVEGMGEGLVLFKILAKDKRVGQNYHMFFEDKRKPPLDIAINPENGTIEYISFFAQDEKIHNRMLNHEIIYDEGIIKISEVGFSDEIVNISQSNSFELIKYNDDIFAIADVKDRLLKAYKINDLNYMLFTGDMTFCGVILKQINNKEMQEIIISQCI